MAGIDSYAKVMLHCDGDDGSAVFTDSSLSPFTITRAGAAQIDTAQSVFGGASGLFEHDTSDYIRTDTLEALKPIWDSWTCECWFRIASWDGAQSPLLCFFPDFSFALVVEQATNKLQLLLGSAGVAWDIGVSTGDTVIGLNTWYHAEIVFSGANYKGYLGGTIEPSLTIVDNTKITQVNTSFRVGCNPALTEYLDGWTDEVRLSSIARNLVDFTPPTRAYSRGSGFMVFMCEAYEKGKKYFKNKGLYLPDDRLYEPEILIPEGI